MRLLSCHLRRVRLHSDLELSFDQGLTVIGGPNEAGKSTLVEALHKGLFLRASATGRGVEDLRARRHGGQPEVEIAFEAGGQRWQLRKRFSGASGTCHLSNDAGVALSGSAAEEALAQVLGVGQPVEGRRIAQLPERWAHLWVRQGDGGANPLSGSGERYDLGRLVEELQRRGGTEALHSPLDRQVLERISAQLALSFTGTGRVRAGSALALVRHDDQEAQRRVHLAQTRCHELDASMEQLRGLEHRLARIEAIERPALEQRQALAHSLRLKQAELEPSRQRLRLLELSLQQFQALNSQREHQLQEQRQLQADLDQAAAALQRTQAQQLERRQSHAEQLAQSKALRERQERLELRLELARLESSERQLLLHRQQFEALQEQAERAKTALAALPVIDQAQVRRLREAEQQAERTQARCDAIATSLELISADLPVQLGGKPLVAGTPQTLLEPTEISIGAGVRLRISPGGGDTLALAQRQRREEQAAITALRTELQVSSSEAAEVIERQRRQLEMELANLRQNASTIPWSGLADRLAASALRRSQLASALAAAASAQAPAGELADDAQGSPEEALADLRRQLTNLSSALEATQRAQDSDREREQDLAKQLTEQRQRRDQLQGSLLSLEQRRQELLSSHGDLEGLCATLQQQAAHLRAEEKVLESIAQELRDRDPQGGPDCADVPAEQTSELPSGLEARIDAERARLEQEKDGLLTRKGQCEQLINSYSSSDPSAELEFRQAEWEATQAERSAIERRVAALQLLQTLFLEAQDDLASRYGAPLMAALGPYLTALGQGADAPLLQLDPQQGFGDLQLRQDGESFNFERLSGGLREQLASALRLALAEVLLPAYDGGLPLVFDDAFTNTDPQRLPLIRQMLALGVSRGVQVILLTCTPDDYRALTDPPQGGRLVSIN